MVGDKSHVLQVVGAPGPNYGVVTGARVPQEAVAFQMVEGGTLCFDDATKYVRSLQRGASNKHKMALVLYL